MQAEELLKHVTNALADMKAVDARVLDVRGHSSFTDIMVVASGTSSRHVKGIADAVIQRAKANGVTPLGTEGESAAEWILVDLGDVVVHVMQAQVRAFYNLEKLWHRSDSKAHEQGVN